jgi:hypothetical protein
MLLRIPCAQELKKEIPTVNVGRDCSLHSRKAHSGRSFSVLSRSRELSLDRSSEKDSGRLARPQSPQQVVRHVGRCAAHVRTSQIRFGSFAYQSANSLGFLAWLVELAETHCLATDASNRHTRSDVSPAVQWKCVAGVRTTALGTNRRLEVGQSMSALPGYFRHQLVPLSPRHRLLRSRDT